MAPSNIDVPPPTGNPYPEGAEPFEGEPTEGTELELIEVERIAPEEGRQQVAPFVAAVAAGVVATVIVESGHWVIKEAWNAATREPVPTPRPAVLYDTASGMTYSRQDNGTYLPTGTAAQM